MNRREFIRILAKSALVVPFAGLLGKAGGLKYLEGRHVEVVKSDPLTLKELAERQSHDKAVGKIAKILQEKNDILNDIPWIESNGFAHLNVKRFKIPRGSI